MTRMILKRPQPRGNPISPFAEPAKPDVESSRRSLYLSFRSWRLPIPAPAGGWHRRGDHPLLGRGWWVPCGDRTRRPSNLPGSSRRPSTLLSRLSSPPRLPRRIQGHLPHLAHALLGGASDHHRLVDPRFELAHGRHRAARHDPVLRAVPFRPLDSRQFRPERGGKPARSLDLAAPNFETTRGAR